MYELTHKDGTKIMAELIDDKWFDLHGFLLKDDCWVWCEKFELTK